MHTQTTQTTQTTQSPQPLVSSNPSDHAVAAHNHTALSPEHTDSSRVNQSADEDLPAVDEEDHDDKMEVAENDEEDDDAAISVDAEDVDSITEEQYEAVSAEDEAGTQVKEEGEEDDLPSTAVTNEEAKEDAEMKVEEEEEERVHRPMAQGVSTYLFCSSAASHSASPRSRTLLTTFQTSFHDNDLFEEHWVPEDLAAFPIHEARDAASDAGDDDEEEEEEGEGEEDGSDETGSEEEEESEEEEDVGLVEYAEMLFVHAAAVGMRESGYETEDEEEDAGDDEDGEYEEEDEDDGEDEGTGEEEGDGDEEG